MVLPGKPSKPRMSALTRSYTGVIRPIPLTFRVLRRLPPLTVWSRCMSSITPNPLPCRPFLPVSRLAPGGGTLSGLPGGAPVSVGGWCGGRHRLAHPLSQDIASPTHCSCINTKTELRVNRQLQSWSVCVWCDFSTAASKRPAAVS